MLYRCAKFGICFTPPPLSTFLGTLLFLSFALTRLELMTQICSFPTPFSATDHPIARKQHTHPTNNQPSQNMTAHFDRSIDPLVVVVILLALLERCNSFAPSRPSFVPCLNETDRSLFKRPPRLIDRSIARSRPSFFLSSNETDRS